MNTFQKGITWVAGIVVVVGGAYVLLNKQGVPAAGEEIVLGGAFGQSGICAAFGEGEVKAAQLAVEEANAAGGINGKPVRLVAEDTQCNAAKTVTAIQKLLSVDRAAMIIGPTWGDSFQGGYPVMRQAKVVSISPSAAMEALEFANEPVNYAFSTWFPQVAEMEAVTSYLKSKGLTKIALVYDQDPFGVMVVDLFEKAAAKNGLEIIDKQELPMGSLDFRTTLTKIKAKNPDAVFARFLAGDTRASFVKQSRDLGITAQFVGTADTEDPALAKSFADVLEGIIYTYPVASGAYDEFAQKYKAKFGTEVQGSSAANAYDAIRVAVEALRNVGVDGDVLEKELMRLRIPGTMVKELSFVENHGIRGGDYEIKAIHNGGFVKVK